MGKITYIDKVNIQAQNVPAINKVRAEDLNEIKEEVNSNYDLLILKALINGDDGELFDVAAPIDNSNAVNLGELITRLDELKGIIIAEAAVVNIQGAIVETQGKTDFTKFELNDKFTYSTSSKKYEGKIINVDVDIVFPADLSNKTKVALLPTRKYS